MALIFDNAYTRTVIYSEKQQQNVHIILLLKKKIYRKRKKNASNCYQMNYLNCWNWQIFGGHYVGEQKMRSS